ncbi:hypothetical protein Lalb_Chr17g0341291 [Lupinus albus]|uniref:Uncharacterized protein n=1 Tax=Lupinus albus TaxID=3870 RepID=A0A6A4P5Q7_LUPAL|nr:hypothetical protein Lalb_Chr17g0341291 [Lupinus albus]
MASLIVGPPEIYNNENATTFSNPLTDLIAFTQNNSPTFISSGNPCVDFFFHVVPDTPSLTLLQRLQLSWTHNPLITLKLLFNLRGLRGTGKSDKEGFYAAALWLHAHHPKTLASNVPLLAEFGYFKDLPEILYRILEGPHVRKKQKEEWEMIKGSSSKRKGGGRGLSIGRKIEKLSLVSREVRVMKEMARAKAEKERASAAKKDKKVAMAKKVANLYETNADFRSLHDSVSDHFAQCLKKDLEFFNSGVLNEISLAAKWCPSLDSSFDRSTLLCESIARRVFPREVYPEYEAIEESQYVYRIRDRLRKEVLVPLRKALELPEVYIGDNRWDLIPYDRVASVAMKFYKDKFLKHNKERFEKYLLDVKSGKTTIAAGALLPHEIIHSLEYGNGGEVAELQWNRMVEDMLKKGKMKNCIAVCDVSGSMWDIPMEVSVALGLLVSELSEEPWKGKVITFSENPQLHLIEGVDLHSKAESIRDISFGMNTNFQKVFDNILEVAVNGNLKEDEMIKRVFVFSDMEFDQASENPWETDYQAIIRKFNEKGYGSSVPQIVFWNLKDSESTPVSATQKGVALVSGFSKNLLTLFLDGEGDIMPENSMEAAISGPEYEKLVVLD